MLPAADELTTICDVVDRCGGHIKIDRTDPKGISLSIFLPAKQSVAPHAPVTTGRIIVVDDDTAMRQFISDALTAFGYDVIVAASGDEVLTLCEQDPASIQLVIADVVMPHLSGRQLASKLARLHPDTKILLISGYPNVTGFFNGVIGRSESIKIECNFLQKPFSITDLIERVRDTLTDAGK